MRIAIIEDEKKWQHIVKREVESYKTNIKIDIFSTGEEFLEEKGSYQIVFMDIELPGKDGFALLPELQKYEIPVIFLTAKGELQDKVKGLTGGAEDYMVKPFEMLELLIRIDKILKRRGSFQEKISIYDVVIDREKRVVTKGGQEVYLKPMEFDCLMMLARNKNRALTRSQLLGALWGMEFEGETRTVDAHIGRIRKKLGFEDVIKTIPRIGYRLEVEE